VMFLNVEPGNARGIAVASVRTVAAA
jgi:hypothetical protein